jgi:hypothetical protein
VTKLRWCQVGTGYVLRGIRTALQVIPDQSYPGMYRIHFRGWISDTVNLSRAKDAAREMAEGIVARRGHRRRFGSGAITLPSTPSVAICGHEAQNVL